MKDYTITATIFETPQIYQNVRVRLVECEPNLFDAIIPGYLIVLPSCIKTDISVAMKNDGIVGHIDYVDFTPAPLNLSI